MSILLTFYVSFYSILLRLPMFQSNKKLKFPKYFQISTSLVPSPATFQKLHVYSAFPISVSWLPSLFSSPLCASNKNLLYLSTAFPLFSLRPMSTIVHLFGSCCNLLTLRFHSTYLLLLLISLRLILSTFLMLASMKMLLSFNLYLFSNTFIFFSELPKPHTSSLLLFVGSIHFASYTHYLFQKNLQPLVLSLLSLAIVIKLL